MGPQESSNFLQQEWEHIFSAPFSFAGAVIALGCLIWFFIHWHYSSRLSSKDATIETKDGQLALAKADLESRGRQLAQTKTERDQALLDLKKVQEGSVKTEAGQKALARVAGEWPHPLKREFMQMAGGGELIIKVSPQTNEERVASANATYLISAGFAEPIKNDNETITIVSSSTAASIYELVDHSENDEDD